MAGVRTLSWNGAHWGCIGTVGNGLAVLTARDDVPNAIQSLCCCLTWPWRVLTTLWWFTKSTLWLSSIIRDLKHVFKTGLF